MTALTSPTLQRRVLQVVSEAVANDRFGEAIRLGVGIVHEFRESVARMCREFDDDLAKGVEARSFVRTYGQLLRDTDELLVQLGRLLEEIAGAEGTAAESFVTEMRLLEEDTGAFRVRLAEALSLASQPPVPVDWDRLKEESDADFAAGRFTTFETPEDMLKGLAGRD